MRNPLKRTPSTEPKPTLRERAASLKASAARVMRHRSTEQEPALTLSSGSLGDQGNSDFPIRDALTDHSSRELPGTSSRDDAAAGGSPMESAMGRHETFETGTPLADVLMAGTMLGIPSSGETLDVEADPAFATIREHRAAYAAWEPHLDTIAEIVVGAPAYIAAEAASEESRIREEEAFAALISTQPTTLAGLVALSKYLPGAIARNGRDDATDDGVMGLTTVCDTLRDLTDRKAVIEDSDPVDWHSPPPGFMAYPAIEPGGFINIKKGLKVEALRLYEIAFAEFSRRCDTRVMPPQGVMQIRRSLRLDELRAAAFGDDVTPLPAQADRKPADAAPSDLAEACLWAVARRAWIDSDGSDPDGKRSDEDLDQLLEPVDEVIDRATEEPAASLYELWAKAQIALEDLERFALPFPGSSLDGGEKLIQATLRDVIALCGPAAIQGARKPASA